MNKINEFRNNLNSKYWKDIKKESYMGVEFDITTTSKVQWKKQRLMVVHYSILDEDTLSDWVKKYWVINKQAKKLINANCFILCILADTVSENALNMISTMPFKKTSETQFGEVNCALIVNMKSQQIYGKCPTIPLPIRNRCKSVLACIMDTYHISEIRKSPKPKVTAEKMKSELKKWGYGLIGFGGLHIVLGSVLDPIWGAILMVLGLGNILISHRTMFLLNGLAIMTAAIFNMVAISDAEIGAFYLLIIMQFTWGIIEIRKFKLYDEVK
jgi:hypothetical protein